MDYCSFNGAMPFQAWILVTGFDEDEDDEEELVESVVISYAPPVPECAGTAHDWREPDPRTGLLPIRGGSGLSLTWVDQCRRCRLIRSTHHPNNLPHNGAQNSSDFYEVSYKRPQYSDWRITADDKTINFSQDKPAEELQEDALLARIVESHDDLFADDESLVLWLIVGQDEDDEDILEEMSSYWHI